MDRLVVPTAPRSPWQRAAAGAVVVDNPFFLSRTHPEKKGGFAKNFANEPGQTFAGFRPSYERPFVVKRAEAGQLCCSSQKTRQGSIHLEAGERGCQGRVVLFQHRDPDDRETGATYTVKLCESGKESDGAGSWRHPEIRLLPETPDFAPIIFEEHSRRRVWCHREGG